MTKTATTRKFKRALRAAHGDQRDEPGAIVAYHRRPRHKGEILCHNLVMHTTWMGYGANGFRWFCCRAGGDWKVCPCGWRRDLGVHYAEPGHVRWTREMLKRLGSHEALDRYVAKRAFPFLQAAAE